MNEESAIFFRDELRAGRAAALSDAEGFQKILFAVEKLGSYRFGKRGDLGRYEDVLRELAKISPLADEVPAQNPEYHLPFSDIYCLVREARNDALHQGAIARHLTNHAVQLALVLEDALMKDMKTASHYMVRDPVCASTWQPISFVRQQMLANSFTYLPILLDKDGRLNWYLLSDANIAKYLQPESERKDRLAKTVEQALETQELEPEEALTCFSDKPVSELTSSFKSPVLVVAKEKPTRLLGILTAFDLL